MNRIGHIGLALLGALPTVAVLLAVDARLPAVAFLGVSVGTCRLPDQVEWALGLRHRSKPHTALFAIVAAVTAGFLAAAYLSASGFATMYPWAGFALIGGGVLVGVGTHLFGDVLTTGGQYRITLLWPFSRTSYQFGVMSSDSLIWNMLFLLTGIASYIILVEYFL